MIDSLCYDFINRGGEVAMKINKVINNNVVTTIDDATGREKVIMGRGIAFQKKPGQPIDESKIEKVFLIENQKDNLRFQQLIHEMPLEYIQISQEIISYAQKELSTRFDDHIYVALTDHLAFAIKRNQAGTDIKNPLLWEIQRIHQEAYRVGLWAIKYLEHKLGVKMPEDEAGFIAMHFVNASLGQNMTNTMSITTIAQDILNIVKYYFAIEFNEEELSYNRFITHLKFFAQRVLTKKEAGDEQAEAPFIQMVREHYKREYACALKIKAYIEKNYENRITEEEIVYLSIHLQRITSKKE